MNFGSLLESVIEKIQFFIQLEINILLWATWFLFFIAYKLFLKAISLKRHSNLKQRFKLSLTLLIFGTILSATHFLIFKNSEELFLQKFSEYLALISLLLFAIVLIKLAQIFVYLILFYKNISQGIPRLIVNLFSVIFSIIVFSYLASAVFSIHITAMLATSAVFSLVLGLALQDTLGNLFSGVAMQIGEPFKIGDWVEISIDANKKWIGQIQEITWRSTFLTSFADETIMIPNKTIAQSQIIIFSNQAKPNRESIMFRLDYDQDIQFAKSLFCEIVSRTPGVMKDPAPRVLFTETSDSWIVMKVFYSLDEFSMRYRVADQIIENVINEFKNKKVKIANNKIQILN